MATHVFDRSGIASLDDLSTPEASQLLTLLEHEQASFLAHQDAFRSAEYHWPKDPLHTWSRCWEYPYVYSALSSLFSKRAGTAEPRPVVADVGSGVTFFPFAVAKLGCRVICTDIDPVCERDLPKAAAQISAGAGEVIFRLSTVDRLAYGEGECDAVYCISVLEHIPDPRETIEELHRILRPGGLLCLTIDLDLRGDHEIGPAGYTRLHQSLGERFMLAMPMKTTHPRAMLTSTTGPYPVGMAPGPSRQLFLAKQFVKPLFGRKPLPADPYLLAVEGSLWQRH